jgi:hypothetical protein
VCLIKSPDLLHNGEAMLLLGADCIIRIPPGIFTYTTDLYSGNVFCTSKLSYAAPQSHGT